MKNSTFKLVVGMPEFMLLSGVYIYSDAKYLSLALIILGVSASFGRYCMDRSDEEARDKSYKKMIKDVSDSVTALSLSKAVPSANKNGGYH